jgi:hypothetical protein
MRVQLDRQNGNQDQTFMYILDTLCFMPEVLHLSTTYPLDTSAHSTMLVFDNEFTTVPYMEQGTIPPHSTDLLQSSSELASKQKFYLAQAWLGSTDLDNTDNPVVS